MKKIIFSIFLISIIFVISAEVTHKKIVRTISNGEVVDFRLLDEVDYIEITDVPTPPENLTGVVNNGVIELIWDGSLIEDCTYTILYSHDDVEYSELATGLKENNFVHTHPLPGNNSYMVRTDAGAVTGLLSKPLSLSIDDKVTQPTILDTGVYVGLTLYNVVLYKAKYKLLDNESTKYYQEYSSIINPRRGNALYFGMENLLDSLHTVGMPENLQDISIITITDSPDKKSLSYNSKFNSNSEYRNYLQNRISKEKISNIALNSYVLGFHKDSVKDPEVCSDVEALASPGLGTHHFTMEDLNSQLLKIAEEVGQRNLTDSQNISLNISGVYDGDQVRLTLDNVDNPENSEFYIEGTFNADGLYLEDVIYNNLIAKNDNRIAGVNSGVYAKFDFTGVETTRKIQLNPVYTSLWRKDKEDIYWQKNNLFNVYKDITISNERKSSIVWVLMDSSLTIDPDSYSTYKKGIANFFAILNKDAGVETDKVFWEGTVGRTDVKNVLFIGSSFLRPQGEGNNEWYRFGPMAPSIAAHSIPELMMKSIRNKYPEAQFSVESSVQWEINYANPDFNYDAISKYYSRIPAEIVYVFASGNSKYSDTFQDGIKKLIKTIKKAQPTAEIYFTPSWHGGNKAIASKEVCKDMHITFVDMDRLNKQYNRWAPGDYYYSEDRDEYYGLKYTVVRHPNDIGNMRIANEYLKASNFPILNLSHPITINTDGPGKVTTPNNQWLGNGLVTLRIEEGEVESITVISDSGAEIPTTYRTNNQNSDYSDYYTFYMPKEGVSVSVLFKDSEQASNWDSDDLINENPDTDNLNPMMR